MKLGQFIASSPTIFPEEYVVEFQKCLDKTPALPFSTIKEVVKQELGRPLSAVFESVDPTPLASASIAQVHCAVLKGARRRGAPPPAQHSRAQPPRPGAAAAHGGPLAPPPPPAESKKEVVLKVLKPAVIDQLTGAPSPPLRPPPLPPHRCRPRPASSPPHPTRKPTRSRP